MSGGGHTIESPGGLLTPNDLEGKFACPVAAWLSSCSIDELVNLGVHVSVSVATQESNPLPMAC